MGDGLSGAHVTALLLAAAALASDGTWHDSWPRFHPAEYVAGGLIWGTTVLYTATAPDPEPRWSGPILLDRPVRRLIGARTRAGRQTAAGISDLMLYGLIAAPIADAAVVAVKGDSNDAPSQMALVSLGSLGIAALGKQTISNATGRERPYVAGCRADDAYIPDCGRPDSYRSFFSGHTALSVTGAALVCVQHRQLAVLGDRPADAAVCAVAATAAGTVGALRVVADRHYFSDVLVGAAVGLGAGLVLPRVLHYRGDPDGAGRSRPVVLSARMRL